VLVPAVLGALAVWIQNPKKDMSLVLQDNLTGSEPGLSVHEIKYTIIVTICICVCVMMMIAFITIKSSSVPLIEGLCAHVWREKKRDENYWARVKVTMTQIESQSQKTRHKRRH